MDPNKAKQEPCPEQLTFFIDQEAEGQEEAQEPVQERKKEEPPYVFYVPHDCR